MESILLLVHESPAGLAYFWSDLPHLCHQLVCRLLHFPVGNLEVPSDEADDLICFTGDIVDQCDCISMVMVTAWYSLCSWVVFRRQTMDRVKDFWAGLKAISQCSSHVHDILLCQTSLFIC